MTLQDNDVARQLEKPRYKPGCLEGAEQGMLFEGKTKSRRILEHCKFGFHIDLEGIKTFEIIVKTGLKCLKHRW